MRRKPIRRSARRKPLSELVTTPDPKRWRALAVLSIAYLMVVLDIAIVNVALPSIQKELHFSSAENLQWIVSGYSLTFGGFLLLGGRIGDILGRRKVFMVGLALFAATSLLAGLSVSSGMLIGARVAQGAAGAILSPSVFSITSVTFAEGSERNKALGVLGAISGAGAAIGVILGGVLTQYAGWEWIFFVNVPIGLLALVFVPRFVRESRADGLVRNFDAMGAFTVTASLMLFVYALTRTTQIGWGAWETALELAGSVYLMLVFILWEGESRSALVPMRIFRRRTLAGANVLGFGLGTMIFGMFFLLSLYMQQVLGFSALKTGIGYLAVALTAVVASGIAQGLVTKLGVKPALLGGLALVGGGLVYFTQISPTGSYFTDLFPGFVILGIGLGFTFVPISIAALAGVTGRDAGLASGLINTSQQIGGALGLAILTTVSTTHTNTLLDRGTPRASAVTSGFSLAFWVDVGVAAGAIVAATLLLRRRDLRLQPEAAGVPAA
jgi:EmrB/QacA subfamily drug resistance transporter